MSVTDRPTLPLESHPRRGRRAETAVEPRETLRAVRIALLALVLTLAGLFVAGRVLVQTTGLWSPAPDTDAFDAVVRDAGLSESSRTETSGSPAFGHPASVSFWLSDHADAGPQTCVTLYRAVDAAGWTSSDRVDAVSCMTPSDGSGWRSDTLTGPDGDQVRLSWDTTYGMVTVDVEEQLGQS